ncbi:DUF305 domain-containing protein [Nocardioides caldifontis]|uniref:DUF305 domain-containing protein n=1 Tax=Nocardioides caldifontis TaxID=2588938 RepID=UPI001396A7C7|nr:DUF305 domain-containing protein [Nocardioides caldifontis]
MIAVAAALTAAAVALGAGVFIGIASHGGDSNATGMAEPGSLDVGFARDMRDHHAQAVEMSVMVRDATEDPEVRTLALDVLLTQQQQLGQMYGWLATWDEPQVGSEPPMAWMTDDAAASANTAAQGDVASSEGDTPGMEGMEHGSEADAETEGSEDVSMPGMATAAQLQELDRSRGVRAERLYLQLMIPHHRAGVAMAEYAAANASQPQVRRLAQSIVEAQTSELKVLQSMLDARGGPVPGV